MFVLGLVVSSASDVRSRRVRVSVAIGGCLSFDPLVMPRADTEAGSVRLLRIIGGECCRINFAPSRTIPRGPPDGPALVRDTAPASARGGLPDAAPWSGPPTLSYHGRRAFRDERPLARSWPCNGDCTMHLMFATLAVLAVTPAGPTALDPAAADTITRKIQADRAGDREVAGVAAHLLPRHRAAQGFRGPAHADGRTRSVERRPDRRSGDRAAASARDGRRAIRSTSRAWIPPRASG